MLLKKTCFNEICIKGSIRVSCFIPSQPSFLIHVRNSKFPYALVWVSMFAVLLNKKYRPMEFQWKMTILYLVMAGYFLMSLFSLVLHKMAYLGCLIGIYNDSYTKPPALQERHLLIMMVHQRMVTSLPVLNSCFSVTLCTTQ